MTNPEAPKIERGKPRPENDQYRILVLLKEKFHREEIANACKLLGQEVVPVETIEQAMYFLETKDHVDACIAEAFLENESSFNFLANLKRMPEHSHVPVMLIAVEPGQVARFTSKSMQKAADLLGAYKFVVMPSFDVRQMLREVQSILPEERKPLKDKHPEQ